MSYKYYEFKVSCGRMGTLTGRFVLDPEEQEKLQSLYGTEIRFGEVLGKHSEIIIDLEPAHIKLITDDQAFLEKARELKINLDIGFNPLDYIEDEEEDE